MNLENEFRKEQLKIVKNS